MRQLVIWILRRYQRYISPLLGNNCRFQPSCSQYSIQAISEYGIFKGSWLSFRRITRCHPLNSGGYDPIPPRTKKN